MIEPEEDRAILEARGRRIGEAVGEVESGV